MENSKVSLGQRIKNVMNVLGLKQSDVAKAANISPNTMSRIVNETGDVLFENIERIFLAYPQINAAYLLGGLGPVLTPEKNEGKLNDLEAIKREYALVEELLEAYRKLDRVRSESAK